MTTLSQSVSSFIKTGGGWCLEKEVLMTKCLHNYYLIIFRDSESDSEEFVIRRPFSQPVKYEAVTWSCFGEDYSKTEYYLVQTKDILTRRLPGCCQQTSLQTADNDENR